VWAAYNSEAGYSTWSSTEDQNLLTTSKAARFLWKTLLDAMTYF